MATNLGLELGNAGPERDRLRFGKRRQNAHQHQMAEMGGAGLREIGQIAEGLQLGLAMNALPAVVKDKKHAPA